MLESQSEREACELAKGCYAIPSRERHETAVYQRADDGNGKQKVNTLITLTY